MSPVERISTQSLHFNKGKPTCFVNLIFSEAHGFWFFDSLSRSRNPDGDADAVFDLPFDLDDADFELMAEIFKDMHTEVIIDDLLNSVIDSLLKRIPWYGEGVFDREIASRMLDDNLHCFYQRYASDEPSIPGGQLRSYYMDEFSLSPVSDFFYS